MPYQPTGNEYVSLPTLRSEDAGIESLNVLHMGLNGLVSFAGMGEPFLKPVLQIDRREISLEGRLNWRRLADWVPEFHLGGDGFLLTGAWVCPPGDRGFFLRLKLENQGPSNLDADLGFRASWAECLHTINVTKRLEAGRFLILESWDHMPVLELRGPAPLASLGFYPADSRTSFTFKIAGEPLFAPKKIHRRGFPASGTGEVFVSGKVGRDLAPGEVWETAFYFGLGPDEIGALTPARELQREGAAAIEKRTAHWLADRRRVLPDPVLTHVMNLNAFFNYFFATGLTLDTGETVALTSRSPRYYVSGAYWDRDSLLWSFPSLLALDPPWARRILEYAFTRQARNFGVHSRCLNGNMLEPGFELDGFCAPILALARYVGATGDKSFLKRAEALEHLRGFPARLAAKKHPKVDLYETQLLPSDDPWPQRYVTYDNVLVWKALVDLAGLLKAVGKPGEARPCLKKSAAVKKAILQHCVVKGKGGKQFAWSVDLEGNHLLYDEPPGSLMLLPYYGFCSAKDPVWKATTAWIHSSEYPYSFQGKPFEEVGCSHAPHPWVLAAVNSLLAGDQVKAGGFFRRARMDAGVACESVDEETGGCASGEAFATCAGFVAHGLWTAFGKPGVPSIAKL